MREKPARQCGMRIAYRVLLACTHLALACASIPLHAQAMNAAAGAFDQATDRLAGSAFSAAAQDTTSSPPAAAPSEGVQATSPSYGSDPIAQWQGMTVLSESFEGVDPARLAPLPGHLAQAVGEPLTREKLSDSLHQLFATGLYETIEVEAARSGAGVALTFSGASRQFIGAVSVYGAKGATINAQLVQASRLLPGTRFTDARLSLAMAQMRQALADNGFHEPTITYKLTPHPQEQLVDIAFDVVSGLQARVGAVQVSGDSGMSLDEFRRKAHLRSGSRINHDTANRALGGVLKYYQKRNRLEADVKLESQDYDAATDRANFSFSANQGPVVRISINGAKLSRDRLKRVIPVFEEGAVDEDLLNEGNRRLRDYYQSLGYFDVKVSHERESPDPREVNIVYNVTLGQRRSVESVSVDGNHYFDSATLTELLGVRAANAFDRHGLYSQALVNNDIGALSAVYQNNGFSDVKITPETRLIISPKAQARMAAGKSTKPAPLAVVYHINEGRQKRVGTVLLEGNGHVPADQLTPLLNTAPGQLFSPQNLAGDRDALMTDYLSRGYDQVSVQVEPQSDPAHANIEDVIFHIDEGRQTFVRKVLVTGLHYTRPETIARSITIHSGDPLNQSAMIQTQRNLYDYSLFNDVNVAVENPNGGATYKTVLLQTTEARRWALTYGLGFEAQTGTPQNNCGNVLNPTSANCNPNGKTGISPRVLFDVTRNDLFGREQSASMRSTYGLLEQKVDLLYQYPHFRGNRNFGLTFSGGYANSQDVTTYVASKLQAGMRWTEAFNTPGIGLSKANTFVYEFSFRRVKVARPSLQVGPTELDPLSAAVRVAGPGFTWIRDTRDTPLDAHRGTYSSFQAFLSDGIFGAQAQFNRVDLTESSYYAFDRGRFVLARNTRFGMERSFGAPSDQLLPLPERLYSGGATSLRGFPINAAGPRDPETGFPIGGAGVLVNNVELRLPPPLLPWFGNTISFVLFHDMGNVFTSSGDIWSAALRIHQPDRDSCKQLATVGDPNSYIPSGPATSIGQLGQCRFDYFSHALGLGLRYHTPVGPIRLDFSYNLNPPIYPVNINYSLSDPFSSPHVGQANHFNFFFSLGQSF